MRMTIGAELPEGYVVSHEDLAHTAGALIAHTLLPLFGEYLPEDAAKANVEAVLTELAYLFDDGVVEIGGKNYHPRLAFVDEAGSVLPGAAKLDTLHEMVADPFHIDPDANITFEAPEYDDP